MSVLSNYNDHDICNNTQEQPEKFRIVTASKLHRTTYTEKKIARKYT